MIMQFTFFILLLWIFSFILLNDFSVKSKIYENKDNVLIIYPHPDDEALSCGGFIAKLAKKKTNITYLILTKGERGVKKNTINKDIKSIREKEAIKVKNILGISKIIHEDYGDGQLNKKREIITRKIESVINSIKPKLIITYDSSGLYGHPDHILVSEVTTKLVKEKFNHIKLWYSSIPKKLYSLANLPEHMAIYSSFKNNRKNPTLKIFIGYNVFKKIKAVYNYKSQRHAFRKAFPLPLPLAFFISLQLFEYFHEVK